MHTTEEAVCQTVRAAIVDYLQSPAGTALVYRVLAEEEGPR